MMGGWLKFGHGVDVHNLGDHGIWEGLQVHLPMGRTYIPASSLVAPEEIITGKWTFYVMADQRFFPDRFTEGDLCEWVNLDALFAGRIDMGGVDTCPECQALRPGAEGSRIQGSELTQLLSFANDLLADALIFTRPGIYSIGKKEEWTKMVRGHLKRAGFEVPCSHPESERCCNIAEGYYYCGICGDTLGFVSKKEDACTCPEDKKEVLALARKLVYNASFEGSDYIVGAGDLEDLRRLVCEHPLAVRERDGICQMCGVKVGEREIP